MAVVIPNEVDVPDYTEQVTLEGVVYTLGFRWSAREASWYMDVMEADGTPILMGTKVLPGWHLGWRCKDPRFPPGAFAALDSSGADEPPGLHDLGDRVTIVYLTAEEKAAARAASAGVSGASVLGNGGMVG